MTLETPPDACTLNRPEPTPKLTTKSVGELTNERFFIASYQRGYRWEAEQVTALLNDLEEFETSHLEGQFYCLQPLVVFKHGDMWEVVDGQQRLTTLFLILRRLSCGEAPFHIQYERHPETPSGLDGLLKMAVPPDSPDLHFIRAAEKTIQEWLDKSIERNRFSATSLTNRDGACAKFIWHCVKSSQEAMRSFARLNGGKIKLKDAELIRAALVRRAGQEEADRHRIALRWDDMERRLREPEFWAFLNKEKSMPDCRIEWLLRLTAPAPEGKSESEHAVFEWFLAELEKRKPAQVWEDVESCFAILEEWYEDNRLFHMVGFLTHQKKPMRQLLVSARQLLKKDFQLHLKGEIRDKVFEKLDSSAGIDRQLNDLTYEKREQVQKVLLLFNLATLHADQTGTVRFSFHAYQTQDWDIEHIHASASRLPESKKEFKGAFESLLDYFKRHERQDKVANLELILSRLEQSQDEDLSRQYVDLCKEFNQVADLSDAELDRLWNLTLLDAKTNRGYGNSPFAIKRSWIIGLDQSERYILPCTRNVFTKAYSKAPVNLLKWTPNDARDYQSAITGTLDAFFKDTWGDSPQETKSPSAKPIPQQHSTQLAGKGCQHESASSLQPRAVRVSFLDLFKASNHPHVEIPLLQRDYAQGRESAGRLRLAFLTAIREAVVGAGTPLNLDFVYGEVNGGRFQPIDGQQRLTTLFLLHWSLAGAEDRMDDFRQEMRDAYGEPRFRYSVRQSSQRFFSALLDYFPKPEPNLDHSKTASTASGGTKPSDMIKDQPWFCLTWMHDPTIAGALVMIDAIATEFGQLSDVGGIYSKLTSSVPSPITLDVLDLGSLGQSEEIYIKMNARGKELTDFEKFKAWLIETHKELQWPEGADIHDQWQVRLDGLWLDLFWHFHHDQQSPASLVSEAFFRTFAALAVNVRASSGDKLVPEWLDEDKMDDPAKWAELFTEACLRQVFEQLESLSRSDAHQEWPIIALRQRLLEGNVAPFDGKPLLEPFFEKPANEKLPFEMRLWLHATCLAFKAPWRAGSREEIHWFRVIRNLLAQTQFNKGYANAVKALDTLVDSAAKAGSILTALDAEQPLGLEALYSEQFKEEHVKARRILSPERGGEWEKAIKEVERHPVFKGQIEVLLTQDANLETFLHRCAAVERLWGNKGSRMGRGDYLLARAVLASCQPFELGWQESINLADTAANWRSQLGRQEGWNCFRNAVSVVLDSLHDVEDIESTLWASLKTTQVTETWMRDLIDHGDHLLMDSNGKVQKYYHHGVFVFKNATKMSEWGDILIGRWASRRNRLIQRLITTHGWTFPSGPEEWREVSTTTGPIFFRGHHIPIHKDLHGQRIACEFGYDRLTVRIHQHEVSPVEVTCPQDASFETLRQSLDGKTDQLSNEVLKTTLDDLAQACDALHTGNFGQIKSHESTAL
jgi:hypothetical protein